MVPITSYISHNSKLNPRLFLSISVLALLTTFSNCYCPEDIVLGELTFLNKAVWPFRGQEVFTFVNANGEELAFAGSTENVTQTLSIAMERLCTNKLQLDAQDVYYNTEFLLFEYHLNNNVYLSFTNIIRNEREAPTSRTDTVLYEIFEARLVIVGEADRATNDFFTELASTRGNSLSNETLSINDQIRIIPDTTLNGVQYSNLTCQRNNPGLFYDTNDGVVLFNYEEDWWYLRK